MSESYPNEGLVRDLLSRSDKELLGFLAKENKEHRRLAGAILDARTRTILRRYTTYTLVIAVFTALGGLAAATSAVLLWMRP